MMCAIFSVKGGSGVSVAAAALGLVWARAADTLLVDFGGDIPTILGRADGPGPGVNDWLNAGDGVPIDSLRRLEIDVQPGLSLVPQGGALTDVGASRGRVLAAVLASDPRAVVADCALAQTAAAREVVRMASQRIVVMRGCYVGIKKLVECDLRPTGIALIVEPGRALGRKEIEQATGLTVQCEIPFDPAISRAVDAGLLATRIPTALAKSLARGIVATTGLAA